MPAPLPVALRQRIRAALQQGVAPTALAHQLGMSPRTVCALYQRFRDNPDDLAPSYHHPGASEPSDLIRQALLLHQQHPTWGAPYVLVQLRRRDPQRTDWPSARTLQRWFRRQAQPPAPAGRKPAADAVGADGPHACWQMDAVEQLRLQTGAQVSWLRWVDEFSGAVLGTVVFPPRELRPGAGAPDPTGFTRAISPLGLAPLAAGGQRRPVGKLQ
jgi:hypothetical protein